MHRPRPAVALIFAIVFSASIAEAQTKVKPGFNMFSAEQDAQIGAESAQQADAQLPMVNQAAVNDYVNRIGQRLAANAGGPQFQYRFRVVNASDINAFALPGGFIYINRGILDQARNEGEVAGVIAHEISHVALRHGTHQASKAYLAQAGIGILGGILGGKVGQGTAQIINAVGGFGLNALFLKYSRDLETQADVRGAQILAATGYTPADMVGFFQTLEKVDPSKKTSFLSDHPAPPDRIARIQKEATSLKVANNPTQNVAGLQQIQTTMRNSLGAAPTSAQIAQGMASGTGTGTSTSTARRRSTTSTPTAINVEPPSSTMTAFTSPSRLFRVGYPSNWQVYQDGNSGVTFAPRGGIGTVGNQTDVVLGAMVNHYDPSGNDSHSGWTLQEATSDLLGAIQQSSPYLKLVSNKAQAVKMAGGTALAASLRGTDPATGILERVTIVTRQVADGHLVYLLFITPEAEVSRYNPVLSAMVNSMEMNPSARH